MGCPNIVQIRVPMGFVTTMYWKSMALTLVEVVQEVVSCGVEGHVVWSCVVQGEDVEGSVAVQLDGGGAGHNAGGVIHGHVVNRERQRWRI